jgi:hypothetical protein
VPSTRDERRHKSEEEWGKSEETKGTEKTGETGDTDLHTARTADQVGVRTFERLSV